ncbi:uncharacterized protein LOC120145688 [Hibiscus syriacus]|uniref:uncharacterized protein LOC120145688 n=1 Tax=Hibiscus syriacus TaxID=106335 RepID=UPI0019235AC1|nr:uncharacterized protein LOC120145688 [Hibiscus syriacus]
MVVLEEEEVIQPVLMNNVTVSDAAPGADDGESSEDSWRSEDGELNWVVLGVVEQNPEVSDEYSNSEDDDDDEEEGLIEIAIPFPGNETTGLNEEPKQNVQSNPQTFLQEPIFQEQHLVELLAEINEEENLIEIDISMGSIKCPAFEIEA